MRILAGLALALSASFASAEPAADPPTPLQLYVQGRYDQAIDAALRENNATGFALAARSDLAAEMMREDPCLECLQRAAVYAHRAIAADPSKPEGHIYLAATLGYESRIIGNVAARFKGFARTAKNEIDAAIADDPRNAWAWAALGGWNVEIVRGGGRTLARWIYGASVEQGMTDFRKAFALDPANFVLHYQYALTLSGYDRERFRSEITTALQSASAGRPRTAYETFAQGRARALLTALNSGDLAAFDKLVRHDQGYP